MKSSLINPIICTVALYAPSHSPWLLCQHTALSCMLCEENQNADFSIRAACIGQWSNLSIGTEHDTQVLSLYLRDFKYAPLVAQKMSSLFQQSFPKSCSANFLPHVIAYAIKAAAMFMTHMDHQHEFCHPQHAVNFSALVIMQLNHLSKFQCSSQEFDYSHCTCATWKTKTMSVLFSFWTVFHPSTCLITKAIEILPWHTILCMHNKPYGAQSLWGWQFLS